MLVKGATDAQRQYNSPLFGTNPDIQFDNGINIIYNENAIIVWKIS